MWRGCDEKSRSTAAVSSDAPVRVLAHLHRGATRRELRAAHGGPDAAGAARCPGPSGAPGAPGGDVLRRPDEAGAGLLLRLVRQPSGERILDALVRSGPGGKADR